MNTYPIFTNKRVIQVRAKGKIEPLYDSVNNGVEGKAFLEYYSKYENTF